MRLTQSENREIDDLLAAIDDDWAVTSRRAVEKSVQVPFLIQMHLVAEDINKIVVLLAFRKTMLSPPN